MLEPINQLNGPTMLQYGGYMQCGYFLTGEHAAYLKQAGVFDYNVVPFTPFFGTGRRGRADGLGCLGARLPLVVRREHGPQEPRSGQPALSGSRVGPPPSPALGILNESTVGVNWWWNRFTRVQFNWIRSMPNHIGSGLAPFDIYGTRFQVEF